MRIPAADKRTDFALELINSCMSSQQQRASAYDLFRAYYLFGADQNLAEYNKVFEHIDTVGSHIYAPGALRFSVELGEIGNKYEQAMSKMCDRATKELNRVWHDETVDLVKQDIVTWSMVYGPMFEKVLWTRKPDGPGVELYPIEPHNIGVLREDTQDLNSQAVIVHRFYWTSDELWRVLRLMPDGFSTWAKINFLPSAETLAPATTLQQMVVTATQPNMQGSAPANARLPTGMFKPLIVQDVAIMHEVWVWDDREDDYRVFTVADGPVLIFDRLARDLYVKATHPFVKTTPIPVLGYLWGMSEIFNLMGLQQWRERRQVQIRQLQELQADPPRAATGMGITDEMLDALRKPGGKLRGEAVPGSEVKNVAPEMPEHIFEELGLIEGYFDHMGGVGQVLQGRGVENVRGEQHAALLATLGSSRIKKKALAVEQAITDSAGRVMKLLRRYDPTRYNTSDGTEFIMAQLAEEAVVKVDAHSHSPVFSGDQFAEAGVLFKAGAIDQEDLIDHSHLAAKERLKQKARERSAAKEQKIAALAKADPRFAETLLKQLMKG